MLDIRRYGDLGTMNIDWLDAHYHFSFAQYYDAKRMGFGPLRVINDDIVKAGGGFAPHPHRDMEIITFVRSGAITHEDSLGNRGKTHAGDIQVMSAGSGITHSEWNEEGEDSRLYQIWLQPRTRAARPRWETRQFPQHGGMQLLASGVERHRNAGALWIDQDAALWGGRLRAGEAWDYGLAGSAYLLVSRGSVAVGEAVLNAGDGAAILRERALHLNALEDAELVLIDLPEHRPA